MCPPMYEGKDSASDNPWILGLNERMNSSSFSGHKEPHLFSYYSSRQKDKTLTKFIGFPLLPLVRLWKNFLDSSGLVSGLLLLRPLRPFFVSSAFEPPGKPEGSRKRLCNPM